MFDILDDLKYREHGDDERDNRLNDLGEEVLEETRVQLMLAFRFMDAALWKMDFKPIGSKLPICTNGREMCFEPVSTLVKFRTAPNELARDYLHTLLHCIFRHPYDMRHKDADAWETATDIAVESIAVEITGSKFVSVEDYKRREAIGELRQIVDEITPDSIYNAIIRSRSDREYRLRHELGEDRIWDLRRLFARDDHDLWPARRDDDADERTRDDGSESDAEEKSPARQDGDEPHESQDKRDGSESPSDGGDENEGSAEPESFGEHDVEDELRGQSGEAEHGDEIRDQCDESERGDGASLPQLREEDAEAEREWESISKQIELELETARSTWGTEAGDLEASLRTTNRKKVDYRTFLRKFSKLTEEIGVNDDEFDYIFYTLGLDRYGNMPLVEPLEYREVQRIRDFVIAIDTSESCSGELVRAFLSKTFEILKENESFGRKVNVHIIQCDAEIQNDVVVDDLSSLDAMLEKFTVRGFGGTDFHPVFEYVDMLQRHDAFENLQGLVYFTDGLGTFPKKMPRYDTAFVFADDGPGLGMVPPWAMKVVVDEEKIRGL